MKNFLLLIFSFLLISSISTLKAQEIEVHHRINGNARIDKYDAVNVDSISILPCYPDSLILIAMFPNSDCATKSNRPRFEWEIQLPKRNFSEIRYDVTVVEMAEEDTSLTAFDTKKPLYFEKDILEKQVEFPSNIQKLEMNKTYAWRTRAYEDGKLIVSSEIKLFYIVDYNLPFDINEIICCQNNLISNGKFEIGNEVGTLGVQGSVDNWQRAYGSPFVKPDNNGCDSKGYIQLTGNKSFGSGIKQSFQPNNKIVQGKYYRFSACVKLLDVPRTPKKVRVKAFAFNSTITSTGAHPLPNSDRALIGWSGDITSNEWETKSFTVWKATKNFDNVLVFAYTNSADSTAYCEVDNICLVETNDTNSCNNYVYNENGPIIEETLLYDTTYHYSDEYIGFTSDLYPEFNTATDTWYPLNDPCASIGGTVPEEAMNVNLNDTLANQGFEGGVERLDSILDLEFAEPPINQKTLSPIPPVPLDCKGKQFVYDPNQPFGGRDIIFVHGLQLKHLCDKKNGVQGAHDDWPDSYYEFHDPNGYFKKKANENWEDHIETWLTRTGATNRYMTVAYNCSQPLDVAAHAMLSQIQLAMEHGVGVQFANLHPNTNPDNKDSLNDKSCFGRNAIIISHSTGGLVTDVAMSIAEKSKTDLNIQNRYGNCGILVDNMKAHLAFHPALLGSKMATAYLALQYGLLGPFINRAVCNDLVEISPEMFTITHQSILRDLVPLVAKFKWGPYVNTSPVPTITISGGHAIGADKANILNVAIHPGLDDGVVTMSSQAGNPNFETGKVPSGYFRNGLFTKVFDMGIEKGRAILYYLHQTLFTSPNGYVGGAAISHLSPTGMVQPVGTIIPITSCENRYDNHYSFIQSASDHYIGPRGHSPNHPDNYVKSNHTNSTGFKPPNYLYKFGEGVHCEEVRTITSNDIYTKGLVGYIPMVEHKKSLDIEICIKIKFLNFKKCLPKIPIWRRTYHTLEGSKENCECSYAYKYVLRP